MYHKLDINEVNAVKFSPKLSVCVLLIGIVTGPCVALSGCGGNNVEIWSAESKSPNGAWIAQASTSQSSGFGTAAVGTGVYVKQAAGSLPPLQILGFSNDSAYPNGITGVKMKWITNSHLDVTYGPGAKLNLQVIKAYGLEFTVHQSTN